MSVVDRVRLWVREQAAFLAALVVLLLAFAYLVIEPGRWSRATGIISLAMLLAGVLRGALAERRVGLLAVRGRVVDTLSYLLLGGALLAVDIRLHG